MLKQELLTFLKQQHFVPSKKMGQNFLINDAIRKNIVQAAKVAQHDCVLEIGPGFGALSAYLHSVTDQLLLIELDKRLSDYLKRNYPTIKLINDDILKVDLETTFKQLNWATVKVVANLPYSISSKIIVKLLKCSQVNSINILVQKEMAQRLFAKPNTKSYNAFSVLTQLFADVNIELKIQPQEFYPAPEVDSWFVSLNKHQRFEINFEQMDKFLRICFASRRKKLLNNLGIFYPMSALKQIFANQQWNENLRAEDLNLNQFVSLFNLVKRA